MPSNNYTPRVGDIVSYSGHKAQVICLGHCCGICGHLTIQILDGSFGNLHRHHNNLTNCWYTNARVLRFISRGKTVMGNSYIDCDL